LFDKSSLEIEMIAGAAFGLEGPSSGGSSMPSPLRLCIPDDSQVYTIRNLVSELSSNYQQLEKLILDRKTGRLKGNALIILNGTHMDLLRGLDTPIKVDDRVVLLPFMVGG
jgi:molybdopterin converting factor small subunit